MPELQAFAASVQAALAGGLGFDPAAGETVLTPDGDGPGHWVGAPSVVVDPESERVLMAYRRRRPRDGSPKERGYAVAIGVSGDGGRAFAPLWQVTKEEVGTSSLERSAFARVVWASGRCTRVGKPRRPVGAGRSASCALGGPSSSTSLTCNRS